MEATEKIWMNGELVDWDDARIHVGVHGLHYGTGVFEGIRCYDTPKGPAVFRLTDHMQRLHDSAQLINMEIPYSVEELRAATQRPARRERPRRVLHPPDRVLRLRPARRLGAGQPGRDGDHVVALGHLPRRGGARDGIRDEDLDLAADAAERRPARLEGDRRLPELDARRQRGAARRLRRGDPADARGQRRRRPRRDDLRRLEAARSTRPTSRPGSCTGSRATRSSRSRPTSATRWSRRT